ncbi:unnamed protein product [Symbiodinium natans]|uniref:OTU domain-containing protein n=1 Tax=Symbiodinium natans TaxID=878477 RepID=A0A812P1Y3_9DINO|nr:unnamed protein product [Symbiodinium natans]
MSHFMVATDPETWSLPSESAVQVDLRPGDPPPKRPKTRKSGTLSDEGPQLRTDLEEELLRAVTLSEGLSGMGKHWASNSSGKADFELSFKTTKYDHFLSHDWATSRWLKLCTMLFIFNSRAAMVATLMCSLVLGLCRPTDTLLNFEQSFELSIDSDASGPMTCSTKDTAPKYGDGVEIHLNSFCVYLVFLWFFFFWQRIRTLLRRPLVVFLDKLCIAQDDPDLKDKGILGLAAFLESSQHLTVLWSARYFSSIASRLLGRLGPSAAAGDTEQKQCPAKSSLRVPVATPKLLGWRGMYWLLLVMGPAPGAEVSNGLFEMGGDLTGLALFTPRVSPSMAFDFPGSMMQHFGSAVADDEVGVLVQAQWCKPSAPLTSAESASYLFLHAKGVGLLDSLCNFCEVPIVTSGAGICETFVTSRPRWRAGLLGVRVGEAANPGPAATATEHKRRERKTQGALIAIIELLCTILRQFAGEDPSVSMQIAGVSALLAVLKDDDDDADDVPPCPPRRAVFAEEPEIQTYEAEGSFKPVRRKSKPAPTGDVQGPAPPPQKGRGKGKPAADPSTSPSAAGTTGKGKDDAAKTKDSALPLLRACDWNSEIVGYPAACTRLNSLGGSVLVTVKDAEQADALSQMMMNAGSTCSARMLWRDKDGKHRLPVDVGGVTRLESFSSHDYTTAGTPLPTLKREPTTAKVVPTDPTTTVFRIVFARPFVDKEVWAKVTSTPKAAVQKWGKATQTKETTGFIKDAWAFAQESRLGQPAVIGLIRLPISLAEQVLALSGKGGVFLEPTGRTDTVKCAVQWLDKAEEETLQSVLERALDMAPQFGAFLGKRQIVNGTPAAWSDELIRELLIEQTDLKEVTVLRKTMRRGRANWLLRARIADNADCYQLLVKEGEHTATYWTMLTRPGPVREARPIADHRGFSLSKGQPENANKPEPKPGKSDGDGNPLKKAAVAKKRQIPNGTTLTTVEADGNCFFTVIGKAVARLRKEPEMPASRTRAEICAHMRKHIQVYEEYWDKCDSAGQELEFFDEYIQHMGLNAKWAGSLEAYAASKAYKVAVLVVPAAADQATAIYNAGARDTIALWHTEGPGHFDWLAPSTGDGLPRDIAENAEQGKPGQGPRGGGRDDSAGSEHTVFTDVTAFTRVGAAQSGRKRGSSSSQPGSFPRGGSAYDVDFDDKSEATVFTRREGGTDVANEDAKTVFTTCSGGRRGNSAADSSSGDIRKWLLAGRRAGSEAVTGATTRGTTDNLDFDEADLAGFHGENAAEPAPTRRRTLSGWTCPECFWKTGKVKWWVQKKQRHIDNFHPDLKAELNLRTNRVCLVPFNPDTCVWRCPVEGCGLGLPATEADSDARLRARRYHWATDHPDKPKALFLLAKGTKEGANKATTAKLSAGVAKRLHQLRAGEAGDHDVTFLKLPPATSGGKTAGGKKRKQRRAMTWVACRRCKRLANTVAGIGNKPCKPHTAGARRPALIARLRTALEEAELDDDVQRDVKYLLELFAEDTDAGGPVAKHDLNAVAWPLGGRDFEIRFVCGGCGGGWKRLRDAEDKDCYPARRRVTTGKIRALRKVVKEGGTQAKAVTSILGILGETDGNGSDQAATTELARGLGYHA